MEPLARIEAARLAHHAAVDGCLTRDATLIAKIADLMADSFKNGHKILACGNGGSACDAMHFAGECVGRFVSDRTPLPALALSADPGIITAIGNDYGFEHVFARQVKAHGKAGDMLVAISTSGASPNVLAAIEVAKTLGMTTVLLTSEKAKNIQNIDYVVAVPSSITAHIQETHITLLQLCIALVEDKLFK